jgi:hypothetical protein
MSDPTERWLPVVGYEGLYEVGDLGHVRSLGRRKGTQGNLVLKPWLSGYLRVGLSRDGKETVIFVHILVLEAFGGPRPGGQQARHGPGGKLDNRLVNLCWGTRSENQMDRVRDGTSNRGERSPRRKFTEAIVSECRRRHAAGEAQAMLAREFGMSRGNMSMIINRKIWTHLG